MLRFVNYRSFEFNIIKWSGEMKSTARENYLKTILELQETNEQEIVNLSLIAKKLGVAGGTVTGMIKQLDMAGLVQYRAYTGCRLTDKGRKIAVEILRIHRIIELFLVEIIGLDWSEVHDEAEKLEHVISPNVLAGIERLLNYPEFDPHGDPIPTSTGKIAKQNHIKLAACNPGNDYIITRILDESKEFLEFISEMTLFPNTEIHIKEIKFEAGIIRLQTKNSKTVIMGLPAAGKILVKKHNIIS